MPSSSNVTEQLDYGFLLITHIVCADQQIHSEEYKYLRELAERANISQQTKDEMEKILVIKRIIMATIRSNYPVL